MHILSSIAIAALLFTSACTRKQNETPCATVMCTANFVGMTVEVTNANGAPVALDEVYTERIPTNEHITYVQFPTSGRYTILDDSYRSKLYNTKANFRLVGKKNGVVVVDEIYTISADCCHVNMENGRQTVIVN